MIDFIDQLLNGFIKFCKDLLGEVVTLLFLLFLPIIVIIGVIMIPFQPLIYKGKICPCCKKKGGVQSESTYVDSCTNCGEQWLIPDW